jgi:hypothetical protein
MASIVIANTRMIQVGRRLDVSSSVSDATRLEAIGSDCREFRECNVVPRTRETIHLELVHEVTQTAVRGVSWFFAKSWTGWLSDQLHAVSRRFREVNRGSRRGANDLDFPSRWSDRVAAGQHRRWYHVMPCSHYETDSGRADVNCPVSS